MEGDAMKIGFIAMSGVRAHNEELTKLGLTLPGLTVTRSGELLIAVPLPLPPSLEVAMNCAVPDAA